ncbi:Arc family DNA-binding protein [Burkholderia contaminans]|uniref:Arc family DNA-binding protein n=1 Tax=Burkholderia contaminans TaxID=488447 RepID=UPI00158ABCB0|nr:Arc family DNA-binding protein [Burkholderia contaminans]
MATQDEYIKTALRLPRHLHADISVSAENAGRSMNAEIIDRLSKSSDMSHLHRVIEQLTQVMQTDREGEKIRIGMAMMLFQQTVSALCDATRLAQDKNATQADIERLQRDIENARASMKAIMPMQ